MATLRFASGALGVVVTTTAAPPGLPAELAIFTERGSVELQHAEISRWTFPDLPRPGEASIAGSGAADPAAIGIAAHVDQWRDILDSYRTGSAPQITARDGLVTVEAIAAIHRAAETGTTIQL